MSAVSWARLHEAWRCLPRGLRQSLFRQATSLAAPRPAPRARGGLPIGVAGLLGTASGLGEGARLMLEALEAAGRDPRAADLSPWFDATDLPEAPGLSRPLLPGEDGSLVVHVNPPYLPFALYALGRARLRGRRIVGYWAWELPKLPRSWRRGLGFVHEVWVPSRFTRDAVADAADLPVHVLPHPLRPSAGIAPLPRRELDIDPAAVLVLYMAHLGSSVERKNPLAAIAAFRRAFGDAPDRVLVLKLIDPGTVPWAMQAICEAVGGARNIRIVAESWPRHRTLALLAAADIVLSLHRSEGFGLVLAEAMQLGKPVIATGWSGNLDFMTRENAALISSRLVPARDPQGTYDEPGQHWAEPDTEHAAEWLRRLAEDPGLRRRIGRRAAADVGALLGRDAFMRSLVQLLGRAGGPERAGDVRRQG